MVSLLVTGGGFIGGNFIDHYFPLGVQKLVHIDAAIQENPVAGLASDKYHFVKGNLRNGDLVKYILKEHQITHVIHFASAQSQSPDSLEYTYDNIVSTHILLEACRLYGGIEKFIYVSADEVYGITEQKTENPTNTYAAIKASAELIVQSYYHSYKMPIITTREHRRA